MVVSEIYQEIFWEFQGKIFLAIRYRTNKVKTFYHEPSSLGCQFGVVLFAAAAVTLRPGGETWQTYVVTIM